MLKKVVVKNQPASQFSKMGFRVLLIGIAMLTLGQSTGCKLGIKEASMLTWRDTVWSKRAYNLRYGGCEREYSEHFENGFRAGYIDTCNGGDGYVPALPPQAYRSPTYRSTDGSKCVNSWFEGYPAGVAAAKKDKAGTYHDILISRMIDSAISQSKTNSVLPDDVRIVPGKKAGDKATGNQIPGVNPSAWNKPAPRDSMPSVLASPSFAAPPQAYSSPDPTPEAESSKVVPTNYSASEEVSATAISTEDAVSDQPFIELDEAGDVPTLPLLQPGDVAPANWNETSK